MAVREGAELGIACKGEFMESDDWPCGKGTANYGFKISINTHVSKHARHSILLCYRELRSVLLKYCRQLIHWGMENSLLVYMY